MIATFHCGSAFPWVNKLIDAPERVADEFRLMHVECKVVECSTDAVVLGMLNVTRRAALTIDRDRLFAEAQQLIGQDVIATVVIRDDGWRLVACPTPAGFREWAASRGTVTAKQSIEAARGVMKALSSDRWVVKRGSAYLSEPVDGGWLLGKKAEARRFDSKSDAIKAARERSWRVVRLVQKRRKSENGAAK